MTRLDQWLDRIALRVGAPDAVPTPSDLLVGGTNQGPLEGISRADAIKVIGGGALMLTAGSLVDAPPATASTPCFDTCRHDFSVALAKRTDLCRQRTDYDPGASVDLLFKSPLALSWLKIFCDASAVALTQGELDRCAAQCTQKDKPTKPIPNCGAHRREHAAAAAAPACYASPKPPRLTPPTPPPPPPPGAHDDCANCMSVGGVCCGTQTDPTTGNTTISACNNPQYPCP